MIMCRLYHIQTFILTKYVYACVSKILNNNDYLKDTG